ncbi:hypothetical protein GHT06_015245 [Daphnia sinensis]|uniref:28S ribosomal protein S28, mitochondrial n=1 Tax=Daphnia sinensis TaxID=1820382 RepID=A0AAD5LA16_9CRUS|nr:hypothetical protein GHT06_015245 [Daphnia sinensis]
MKTENTPHTTDDTSLHAFWCLLVQILVKSSKKMEIIFRQTTLSVGRSPIFSSFRNTGFGKAFERLSLLTHKSTRDEPDIKFATLLRHSKFMQLGDPQGKVIEGKIVRVVGNDLYIDFGWKFECVCPKPLKNERDYVRGSKVRLRLQRLELSTKFLGATKEITLREADAHLIGIVRTPFRT